MISNFPLKFLPSRTLSDDVEDTPEMISGSLLHDRADEHSQLPDEFVASMESKEHKQMEDLAGIQAQHHEQLLRKELPMVAQDNDATNHRGGGSGVHG